MDLDTYLGAIVDPNLDWRQQNEITMPRVHRVLSRLPEGVEWSTNQLVDAISGASEDKAVKNRINACLRRFAEHDLACCVRKADPRSINGRMGRPNVWRRPPNGFRPKVSHEDITRRVAAIEGDMCLADSAELEAIRADARILVGAKP